jgi:hypothetical protein
MLDVPLCVSAPRASVTRPGTFAIGANFSQKVWRLRLQLLHTFFIGLAKMLLAEGFRSSLDARLVLRHCFTRVFVRLVAFLLAVEVAVLRVWI